jgi:prepilin-type processing-associated H-X9-DG protein
MTTEQITSIEQTSPAKKLYATREEANAASPGPDKPRMKLFEVNQHGTSRGFAWADGHAGAIVIAARQDGFAARLADSKGGLFSKERIASRLAEFTDQELAELGLSRKKVKK